jgi:hypothetical protein
MKRGREWLEASPCSQFINYVITCCYTPDQHPDVPAPIEEVSDAQVIRTDPIPSPMEPDLPQIKIDTDQVKAPWHYEGAKQRRSGGERMDLETFDDRVKDFKMLFEEMTSYVRPPVVKRAKVQSNDACYQASCSKRYVQSLEHIKSHEDASRLLKGNDMLKLTAQPVLFIPKPQALFDRRTDEAPKTAACQVSASSPDPSGLSRYVPYSSLSRLPSPRLWDSKLPAPPNPTITGPSFDWASPSGQIPSGETGATTGTSKTFTPWPAPKSRSTSTLGQSPSVLSSYLMDKSVYLQPSHPFFVKNSANEVPVEDEGFVDED